MFDIPVEIVRAILREVTAVPAALDTSFSASNGTHADSETVAIAIRDSMRAKCTLSVVSKEFHLLIEEHLYEIIIIRAIDALQTILQRFGHKHPDRLAPGWWCKLLDVKLTSDYYHFERIQNELCAIVSDCPRLTDLRFSVMAEDEFVPVRRHRYQPAFLDEYTTTPPLLFRTIVSTCWSTLRRLELGGDGSIPYSLRLLKFTLSHLTELRDCRILELKDDEATALDISSSPSETPPFERNAFQFAESGPVRDSDVLLLPHLHTLHLTPFVPDVNAFQLPALKSVAIVSTIWATTETNRISAGLKSHAAHLTHFTYHGGLRQMWSIAETLPLLRTLVLDVMDGSMCIDPTAHTGHQHLETIVVLRSQETYNATVLEVLQVLHDTVQVGTFPQLHTVRVWGDPMPARAREYSLALDVLRDRFAMLGLNLEAKDATWECS